MVQHSALGHFEQFSSSKRGFGCHIGVFKKHGSMNSYFSNNSLIIIEMFRIKEDFIYRKDFASYSKTFQGKIKFKFFSRQTSPFEDFSRR